MMLWLRVRRVLALVLTLVAALALGRLGGQRTVTFPSVIGAGPNSVLLGAFVPLAWTAALVDSFATTRQAVEVRPGRMLRVLDASLFLGTATLSAALFALLVVRSPAIWSGVGPVLVLAGVACIVTLRVGPAYGVLTTSTLLICTLLYGVRAPGGAYVRVAEPDGDPLWSVVLGVAVCLVAAGLLLGNRVPTSLGATERLG